MRTLSMGLAIAMGFGIQLGILAPSAWAATQSVVPDLEKSEVLIPFEAQNSEVRAIAANSHEQTTHCHPVSPKAKLISLNPTEVIPSLRNVDPSRFLDIFCRDVRINTIVVRYFCTVVH